jgi:shikimate kinase
MGKLNLIIQDNIDQKFREEVFKRKGMKKGNLTEALEEAMTLWTENDVTKELEETATSMNCRPLTRDKAIDTLRKMGRVAMPSLARIAHHTISADASKDKALDAIDEILKSQN